MELSGELGEVLASEMEFERMVRGVWGDESCDFERRGGGAGAAALSELLHERRPLTADADVEVDDVDAGRAGELFEESLDGGEVGELEDGGDFREGLEGAELEDDVERGGERGRGRGRGEEEEVEGVTEVEGGAD